MKKFSILMMVIAAILMMGSCGNRTQQVPFDNGDSADIANADPTIYGISGVATTMNVLQLITDTGDTLSIDLTAAQENGQVLAACRQVTAWRLFPMLKRLRHRWSSTRLRC